MKKNISWKTLILIGIVAIIIGRVIGGVVGPLVGVFGDIVLLIGVVNMIRGIISRRKNPK